MTLEEEIYNTFLEAEGSIEIKSASNPKDTVEKLSTLYEESKKKDGGSSYINAYNKYINFIKESGSWQKTFFIVW